ncbi:hypothetical protein P5G50_18405 [Leifsonia sp. F6_8S_P_1B]|uniref:DUF7455 domain-containing protein n=1 Tax=Leifsonia williamsii TaxID=3035919 RepID=A0ABT8KJB4_9MICO|nr:hypothetical protein [Leifsonia williamsii]MDN4616424.1 hypothetical protein [Leifsonia williamsii]
MTDTAAPKPLPAPPEDPHEPGTYRVLHDGDTCDHASCPAIAYVRVHMYRDGDKDELAGTLHWCAHHWHEVRERIWTMALDGKCGIIDETEWIA